MSTRPRRAAATAARALRAASVSSSSSSSSASVVVVSDSESDAFAPGSASASDDDGDVGAESSAPSTPESEPDGEPVGRGAKRKRSGVGARGSARAKPEPATGDIEDCVPRPHAASYHSTADIAARQDALLEWFERVRDERGMPWRKRYDAAASTDAKGQRAYEIWVSEVMLQQTQVATVIAYWNRWMERWPTIADLAGADLEEVNAAWRGLGYYRRAKSLLEGAKVITSTPAYNNRLPSDPDVLEKGVPGVGRYTAGAICSMAYGVRTPVVDGNIHRVLTRLLGVHATQTAPETIRFLWDAAEKLVDALPRGLSRGIAGDWNQALMELGATLCKPTTPDCASCPLQEACHAYAELSRPPPPPGDDKPCGLCEPIPAPAGTTTIPSVTVFPMKKQKKESRVENEVVCVTEWVGSTGDRRWIFTKRPEKGLLAGLFEPPTVPVAAEGTEVDHLAAAATQVAQLLGTTADELQAGDNLHRAVAPVQHIFSHINMTYHVQHLCLRSDADEPPALASADGRQADWLSLSEVCEANVGTGVKKVWAALYTRWGGADEKGAKAAGKPKAKTERKPAAKKPKANGAIAETAPGAKVVKKVCMPSMPRKAVATKVKVEVEVKAET